MLERFMRMDSTTQEIIHVKFLPQILFVTVLCLLYIGSRHYAEKNIRSITLLEREVQDLRADYTTLKADYMFASKRSEVAKKASLFGLVDADVPPKKILQP